MSTEPIPFLRETFPAIFNKGVSLLRSKADAGNERAKATLEDITAVAGAAVVVVEGEGTVYYAVREGTITSSDSRPEGLPMQIALAFPADAVEIVLGEAAREGAFEDERVAMAAAHVASKKLEKQLAGKTLSCHVKVKDAPDLGDVVVKAGLNLEAPPEKPGFTAELKYDDLESVREGKLNVQQLFMGGKLRLQGDYSLALQIAMQLAAQAQQQAQKK